METTKCSVKLQPVASYARFAMSLRVACASVADQRVGVPFLLAASCAACFIGPHLLRVRIVAFKLPNAESTRSLVQPSEACGQQSRLGSAVIALLCPGQRRGLLRHTAS